jgi:hypothetical protein
VGNAALDIQLKQKNTNYLYKTIGSKRLFGSVKIALPLIKLKHIPAIHMSESLLIISKRLLIISFLLVIFPIYAEILKDYRWTNRVIITFANTEENPDRQFLIQQIRQYPCEYMKRDLVHIDLIQGTDEYKRLSQKFSVSDRTTFKLLLLGKDGEIKLSTSRVELKDVFSLIDTMPLRKREIQSEKC